MYIEQKGRNVCLNEVKDFNVNHIFECGQCFHFEKLDHLDYVTVAYNRALRISQKNDMVIMHNTDMAEYNEVWKYYFDMDTDYGYIKKWLLDKDDRLAEAVMEKNGIRILRQEFHEMLMSFIISQNKQIPHIKQIVKSISEKYGQCVGNIEGKDYYAFPGREILSKISEDEYRELKTGFRAPYLKSASDFLVCGTEKEELMKMKYKEAKEVLKSIKGVGDKVADCVLLFSLGHRNAFPIDVWIKRIMEQVYFKKETSVEEIAQFALENFGDYGGYAQQYLFYYGRDAKAGKKQR